MRPNRKLRDIKGQKIRRQYYNVFFYLEASVVLPMVTVLLTVNTLFGKSGTKLQSPMEIFQLFFVFFVLMSPVLLLSLLNRFLFGKIVCVLDENGLHYSDGFMEWSAVTRIEYDIHLFGRHEPRYCDARVIGNGTEITLRQAPHFLLKKAKKYHPDIEVGLSKHSKGLLAFFAIVLTAVIALFSVMTVLH